MSATPPPLGVFARGRRDWGLPNLMLASGMTLNSSGGAVRWALNNNSAAGNYLAVYGVLAWRGYSVKLMCATPQKLIDSGPISTGYSAPLIPGMPALDGVMTLKGLGANSLPNGLVFWADGNHWLGLGDVPLFVLPPGWQLGITEANTTTSTWVPEYQTVSFVWGYYAGAKLPQLEPFVSTLAPQEEST
jgi:hypothetical protein